MTTSPPRSFPSLTIRTDEFEPRGAFAEAQAAYLEPDRAAVGRLGELLRAHDVGIVAHYYMDPELQGVLTAAEWPHIHISDSLVMADRAVKMAEAGARTIIVLGVDFMSENVRAMLDAGGFPDVPVYRVVAEPIGCTLAEAAAAPPYWEYLEEAARTPRSLHVIYINTSLVDKARAHHLVPTITCTSSNAVKTVLQAFHQIPDAHVWYGPDSYMGSNLEHLFRELVDMDEDAVAGLHPAHTPASIRALQSRFHHFDKGVCIVHDLFGQEVVEQVQSEYADVFITAHLEVPGEMFRLALAAQHRGEGVVGSTANILSFISDKVERASRGELPNGIGVQDGLLRFVLGTEAGMITAIVRRVREILRECRQRGGPELAVEIIFPVAREAVTATDDPELAVVPGVQGTEGCSPAGGCVTCRYMKMNSLDGLMDVLGRLGSSSPEDLTPLCPHKYTETIDGRTAADLGGEPILHMRGFQQGGELPPALAQDVLGRAPR